MTTAGMETPTLRREIGSWSCGRPGPTLCVLAGIHGNERSGITAAQRVIARLQEQETSIAGQVVAFAGNLQALGAEVRYLSRDLNRRWASEHLEGLAAQDAVLDSAEDREQRDLLACFQSVEERRAGPLVFVDLHSSSAAGSPFICLADTIDNRRVAMATGVPLILGIEETIDGASLEYWSRRGVVNFAVEGGRHQDAATVDNHEAVLWLLLDYLGMVRSEGLGDIVASARRQIQSATAGVPDVVEIVERHAITPQDEFVMAPGFLNFQKVARGDVLATDRNGEVRAPADCRVMLPLYQAQGDDGFFLARDVHPFWLRVAAGLRWLRLDAAVHWLPGIRRDPVDRNTILVNPKVARWFVTEFFHLLGFRKARKRSGVWAFSRRHSLRENRLLGRRAT